MQRFRAYVAAIKPERTFFNVLMTLAGFLFVSLPHLNWVLLIYTLLGTSLIIMSACAANNYTDRGLDARMPRTRKRGTVTGEVSSSALLSTAIVFGLVGLAVLWVHVNGLTALLGLVAYIDYVVLYGWTKRTTPWSTLAGTISGAIPLMAGYTAVTGRLDLSVWILGLIMVFWQMPHFYAIGIFRLEDYRAGSIPVWPIRYGIRNTQIWMLVYTAGYVISVGALAVWGGAGWIFALVVGLLGLYWLWLGIRGFASLKPDKWARQMFGFSLHTLLLLAIMLSIAPLLT